MPLLDNPLYIKGALLSAYRENRIEEKREMMGIIRLKICAIRPFNQMIRLMCVHLDYSWFCRILWLRVLAIL